MNGFTELRPFLPQQHLKAPSRPGPLALWRHRWVTRRHLLELSAAGLADVGLSAAQQHEEGHKAFWRK
jgi:uncharacterized protein YjiS (DUF1127 family)